MQVNTFVVFVKLKTGLVIFNAPITFCVFVPIQLSLGAVHSLSSQKPATSKRNFHGCVENLLYNGLNLIDLAKHNDHQVTAIVSAFN